MKIRRGDNVIIISGKDKGKSGTVTRAIPKKDSVVVEGVNLKKKHQRSRRSGGKGQIIEIALPIHISNVLLKDPKTGTGTRVGFKEEKAKKVRFAKKSGVAL